MKLLSKYKELPVPIKATLWSMIAGVLQKCVSVLTTPVFTRLLSTEQYGQFTSYNSWMNITSMFATFNLAYAVFNKGMSKFKSDRDGYTSVMLGTTTSLSLICLGLYLCFKSSINRLTELSTFITILMVIEILFYQAVPFWLLRQRYEYKYKPVVFFTFSNMILNAIVSIVFVYFSSEKGFARIISSAVVNIIFGIIVFFIVFKRGKLYFRWEYVKFAVLFNIPLIPHYLSTYILDQSDRIMIQKMCGLEYVGLYGVAYSIGMVVKLFSGAINQSLTPWLYHKLEKQEYRTINQVTNKIMVLYAYLLLLFICLVPEVLQIVVAPSYIEAKYVVPSIAASTLFTFMYSWYSNVEFFFDSNKFSMVMSCLGAALNICLNLYYIPKFGYIAAGYTTLFSYFIFMIGHLFYAISVSKRKTGDGIFQVNDILKLSSAFIFLSIFITSTYNILKLVRYIFAFIIAILLVNNLKSFSFVLNFKKNMENVR